MISLPLGILFTTIVFLVSIGISNLPLYFNFHSFVLVGGGTLGILLFSNPVMVLRHLGFDVLKLFTNANHFSQTKAHLAELARDKQASVSSNDELIKYAQDMWTQGVAHDLFIVLLSQKRKEIEQRSVDAIQCLKNLAKYPPALGMAGTVMGIVTLFQTLGTEKDKIGPALALALTATFFGLAIANGIVMPLSDRLQVKQISQKRYLQSVYEILLLINQGEATHLIEDEVGSRAS